MEVDNGTQVIMDRQQTQFDFFYIVVTVFPSDDTCLSMGVATTARLITLDLADNFNPIPFPEMELTKNFNITVEPAFSGIKLIAVLKLYTDTVFTHSSLLTLYTDSLYTDSVY